MLSLLLRANHANLCRIVDFVVEGLTARSGGGKIIGIILTMDIGCANKHCEERKKCFCTFHCWLFLFDSLSFVVGLVLFYGCLDLLVALVKDPPEQGDNNAVDSAVDD